jgi:hypothetical protein
MRAGTKRGHRMSIPKYESADLNLFEKQSFLRQRQQLETGILKLVAEFEWATGLLVAGILPQPNKADLDGYTIPYSRDQRGGFYTGAVRVEVREASPATLLGTTRRGRDARAEGDEGDEIPF